MNFIQKTLTTVAAVAAIVGTDPSRASETCTYQNRSGQTSFSCEVFDHSGRLEITHLSSNKKMVFWHINDGRYEGPEGNIWIRTQQNPSSIYNNGRAFHF